MRTLNFSKFIGSDGRHASPSRTIYPMRFLLVFAQGGLLSPLLPLLHETFRVSPGELGLLTSMSGLSSVVMDIIAAYLLQRRPLLSLLLQGIGLAGVALLGSILAPSFYWLVAAQMLLGFGLGITRVACLMVIVTGTPRAVQGRAYTQPDHLWPHCLTTALASRFCSGAGICGRGIRLGALHPPDPGRSRRDIDRPAQPRYACRGMVHAASRGSSSCGSAHASHRYCLRGHVYAVFYLVGLHLHRLTALRWRSGRHLDLNTRIGVHRRAAR